MTIFEKCLEYDIKILRLEDDRKLQYLITIYLNLLSYYYVNYITIVYL